MSEKKHIKFFKDITKKNVDIAGGKGASLGEMTNAELNVPPGFIVLANAFDRFVEETGLKEEISARLAEVKPDDINSVDRASNVIRDVVADTPMPDDLAKEILEAYDELFAPIATSATPLKSPLGKGGGFVAVRSSATAEDSEVASWAGELESYLNTTRENICERVKKCWSSLFTPRAIFYRFEKNLQDSHVSVAVVVQKMVQSDISGIVFTVHPVTEDPNQMIIEAGYGLGEAIVSGQITPDSYIVSKSEMSIIDINIGVQTRKLVKCKIQKSPPKAGPPLAEKIKNGDDAVSNKWIDLSEGEGGKQKLSGKQIIEVAEVCKKIEDHYGFPCDIEWAIEDGKIYITQSRPITTLKKGK